MFHFVFILDVLYIICRKELNYYIFRNLYSPYADIARNEIRIQKTINNLTEDYQ